MLIKKKKDVEVAQPLSAYAQVPLLAWLLVWALAE